MIESTVTGLANAPARFMLKTDRGKILSLAVLGMITIINILRGLDVSLGNRISVNIVQTPVT